jgi:hypothetical protein
VDYHRFSFHLQCRRSIFLLMSQIPHVSQYYVPSFRSFTPRCSDLPIGFLSICVSLVLPCEQNRNATKFNGLRIRKVVNIVLFFFRVKCRNAGKCLNALPVLISIYTTTLVFFLHTNQALQASTVCIGTVH